MSEAAFPKISIVTASYNLAPYLEQTILSILDQNYPNLEYIIIDGGSTDGSVDIIRKYEPHLAYWVSEPDGGLYDALQKGFDRSTGEIMGWLNADDLYHPGALSIVQEVFTRFSQVQWLTGFPTCFDEQGRVVNVKPRTQLWSKYDYYLGNYQWIQQESTFWRRTLWDKSGAQFSPDCRLAGDYDLWLRFFRQEKLYAVEALVGGYRIRKNQLSRQHIDQYQQEVDRQWKAEKSKLPSQEVRLIRRMKLLLRIMDYLNLRFLKVLYNRLFDYPPKIIFDPNRQCLTLKKDISRYDIALKTL